MLRQTYSSIWLTFFSLLPLQITYLLPDKILSSYCLLQRKPTKAKAAPRYPALVPAFPFQHPLLHPLVHAIPKAPPTMPLNVPHP